MSNRVLAAGPASVAAAAPSAAGASTFAIVVSLSFCHLLNDMMQSMIPALYPILKDSHQLDFGQIGLITLAFFVTAAVLQPLIGLVADRRPMPYSLATGMGFTLAGLLLLSVAWSYPLILLAASLIGIGSAVFHPEASRVARMASGGRYGLAQSLFQVGGNLGSATGPLLAAFVVLGRGQGSVAWFSAAALIGMMVLIAVGSWFSRNRHRAQPRRRATMVADGRPAVPTRARVLIAITILMLLLFSKNVYSASFTSFYTFYLIDRFAVSVQTAQIALFVFLGSIALGGVAGGWIGDRIGRIPVIWVSILGTLPLTLALPHVGLAWTYVLTVAIGLIMSSSFSAILVYAQELVPGRVGLVAGLFFGLSFGLGGLGAAALGEIADHTSIRTVYLICSFLPLLGLLTAFLPRLDERPLARPA